MERYPTGRLIAMLFLAVVFVVTMSAASATWPQEKGLAQQIQGTWTLVSIYNEADGKRTEQFGSNPRGSLILTPEGRFMSIIMKASLPKFAANSRVKGTTEENQAVVHGSVAYFGTYAVPSDKENTLMMRIEGSTYPNWADEEQKRIMTLTGDEMKWVAPVAAIGGTTYMVWKRTK